MTNLVDKKTTINKRQKILNWFFILYVLPTSVYGFYLYFNNLYIFTIYYETSVAFKNGFIFANSDRTQRTGNYNAIYYPNGKLAIKANVLRAQEYGDFIYGYREQNQKISPNQIKESYFICNLNEICTTQQAYSAVEYREILKEKNIPDRTNHFLHDLKKLQIKEWILVKLHLKEKLFIPKKVTQ